MTLSFIHLPSYISQFSLLILRCYLTKTLIQSDRKENLTTVATNQWIVCAAGHGDKWLSKYILNTMDQQSHTLAYDKAHRIYFHLCHKQCCHPSQYKLLNCNMLTVNVPLLNDITKISQKILSYFSINISILSTNGQGYYSVVIIQLQSTRFLAFKGIN